MANDYIGREAAWNGIYNCPTKTDADGYIWVRTKDVAHMIDDIPAANVVEVVQCKDCKRWKDPHDYECPCHSSGDPFIDYDPEPYFFCAIGERRADNGN